MDITQDLGQSLNPILKFQGQNQEKLDSDLSYNRERQRASTEHRNQSRP